MRKVLHFVVGKKKIVIPVVIILIGYLIYTATRPPAASLVETQTIKKQDVTQTLSATGSIDSTQSASLSFIAGGKLVYLNAKKGDHVKKGQTIAVLDQRSMQKNLESALRDYSKQRNTFEQSHDDYYADSPDHAINAQVRRILQDNQYDLDKAVISVELQDLAREQSVLTSPIDGIVTKADVETTGVNVTTSTTFTIANPDMLVFKMDIDEADIGKVKDGQPVTVTLDAFPDDTLHLRVDSIDFTTHATSTGGNAYTVEATLFPQTGRTYRLGMNGDAEITLQKVYNVLTVPITSVVDDSYVYIKKGNTFEKKKIKLGISDDTDSEVLSGISEGDQVALDPTAAEKIK